MEKKYEDFILEKAQELLSIDSPTGYTTKAIDWLYEQFRSIGCNASKTIKGGLIVDMGEAEHEEAVLLEAHVDTLGAMVAEIKSNGRLRVEKLGGMNANNAEGENVRIVTKEMGRYTGTCQLINASIHVNGEYDETKREWETVEIVLDEDVKTKEDAQKIGIQVGDIVCFDPRTTITEKGFIKSRFLDDKLSVAILLSFATDIKEKKILPKRKIFMHFTVYEEVGHGGCASVPKGVTEVISVDMGCVGEGLNCTEKEVSICVKDSGGPYNYDIVKKLIEAAKKIEAQYALDIYPHYGSDVEATLSAGHDVTHALIGPGVYASHGYERSHKEGAFNTFKLLKSYLVLR